MNLPQGSKERRYRIRISIGANAKDRATFTYIIVTSAGHRRSFAPSKVYYDLYLELCQTKEFQSTSTCMSVELYILRDTAFDLEV